MGGEMLKVAILRTIAHITIVIAHRGPFFRFLSLMHGVTSQLLVVILALLANVPAVVGQPVTPEEEWDYVIEDFTLPGGRLGNNVNSIVEGPYGFLWFGSHGGLHRYDGYEFVTYKNVPSDTIGETTTLSFNYIENLYWDSQNTLWVMSYGNGVYRFDPAKETFKHYPHNSDDSTTISHPRTLCAVEDEQGQIWIGTEDGLNRFDPETETFTRYYSVPGDERSLPNSDVRNLYVDKEGALWIATGFVYFAATEGGLSHYDAEDDSFTNFVVHDPEVDDKPVSYPVRGLLEDSQGNFWVGNSRGLYKMNRENGTFSYMDVDGDGPFAPGSQDRPIAPVYDIHEDAKGNIWVGTILDYNYPSHLIRHDPSSGKTVVLPVRSATWDFGESSDGTYWVGGAGDSGKVLRIRPKTRTFDLRGGQFVPDLLNQAPDLQFGRVNRFFGPVFLASDPRDNSIWAAIVKAGIEAVTDSIEIVVGNFNPATGWRSFEVVPTGKFRVDWSIPANQFGVSGMGVGKDGTIWFSLPVQEVGVFAYNPDSKNLRHFAHDPSDPSTISSNSVVNVMMDSRGDVWANTYDQGVNRINGQTGAVTQYHFTNDPWDNNRDSPFAIAEGRDGRIWIAGDLLALDGTYMLVEIDPFTEEMQLVPMPRNNVQAPVYMMAISPVTGLISFAHINRGLGTYDPSTGHFSFFDTSSGTFPFDQIAGIVCDQDGTFWISDAQSSSFVRMTGDKGFYSFEEASLSSSDWRQGLAATDGSIYFTFGNLNGWVKIDPNAIALERSASPTRVQLVELSVMGVKQRVGKGETLPAPIWLIEQLVLPNEAKSFEFRFTDFDFQESVSRFRYRLYPIDENWTLTSHSPLAAYHRIPPGSYRFEVQSMRAGFVEDQVLELAVLILPPWWTRWWAYVLYVIFFGIGVFSVHTIQKGRVVRKERERTRDKELAQAKEIEKAYNELKSTQEQLIHSEKMASLGELTAGIAHEIQNPLNFVNNFSDVNKELVDEMKEALDKGDMEEAHAVLKDLRENEDKIVHHGKRAEEIVRSMLQHSRGSEEEKLATDINALADEYLRLAYHGMRAKDKSFNVKMESTLDDGLKEIEVIPQDIGRVLLNLITNAFHAVSEKKKAQSENGYEPEVTVTTKMADNEVQIEIADNGTGIPEDVVGKIFEPFFTTKKTGQGTGLGLSLSYEIVRKGHGGDIKVNSTPGEGTAFTILLPDK